MQHDSELFFIFTLHAVTVSEQKCSSHKPVEVGVNKLDILRQKALYFVLTFYLLKFGNFVRTPLLRTFAIADTK